MPPSDPSPSEFVGPGTGPPLIRSPAEFTALLEGLRREPLIAIDTEAASFHRYHDHVYLLQLSTRTGTWIVDPLLVPGLPGLGQLLIDPDIELVFHDADYDLRLLHQEFGFRAARLFDTRVAAQFLNEPGIGLAALLEKHFDVRLDKRFQRADWSARPLSAAMLAYAALDTRWLPELRDHLRGELERRGRLAWVEEECRLLTGVRWPEPVAAEEAALAAKGARNLSARQLAVFREAYVWRDRTAAALDRAPFRVLGNEALFALTERLPGTPSELASVPGVGRDTIERRGEEILDAVRRGLALPEEALPRYERARRHRPDLLFDMRLERLKARRVELAQRLDLQTGVLAPNWLLEAVARAAPVNLAELERIEGVRRWQVETIGQELVAAIVQRRSS